MFDSESWPFANLLTLSERIGPQAPLGMLHEVGRLAVKMQASGQRRHQHVSGCTFDLVPPAGFEPARAAPEAVFLYSSDLPKRTSRCSARARIGHNPPVGAAGDAVWDLRLGIYCSRRHGLFTVSWASC